MNVSWDFNTATLSLIAIQIVGFVVYLVRTSNKAEAAHQAAQDAQESADKAHLNISAHQANLSLFREQVAANYVDRDALRDIKRELIDAINKLGDRMDQSINGHK
jgi:hypothetical protein